MLLQVGFADFAPVLVASEASLDDLNSRLDNPVSICNFRANIIVSGSTLKPFEEVQRVLGPLCYCD